ncbi:hypothetical protein [Haloarchaeobius sp. DFWS5]|uniref:hypothetical protein n=1 Tax=Haloarchaeobius sp. DFWS5 TaxID=3446114 RepID=UPI003EBFE879
MSRILRAVAATMWLVSAGLYVLAMAGVLPELWGILSSMPAVTNGPWWEMAQRFKWLASVGVPALLLLTPIVYWLVGGVKEEGNKRRYRI